MTHERRPPREWQPMHTPGLIQTAHASTWRLGHVVVISALEDAEYPDGSGEEGPQWHVSISARGKRPKPHEVRRALHAFGLEGAEEDNHHPGVARHFWRPVDPARRTDCECKETEVVVREPDGYTWTNPHEPAECRGCEFGRLTGRPCSIHTSATAPRDIG